MNIFDIDFKQQTPELLPPDKRDNNRIGLIGALLNSIQWGRDLAIGNYKNGSNASSYAAGTYPAFALVIFNKSVYYSLNDNNTSTPLDTTQWLKIQDNFIGVSERVKFNGQNLILEYALNKRFNGTFRPPPSSTPSDIYMRLLPSVIGGFNIGQSISSVVGQTTSPDKIGSKSSILRINNFQVFILSSVYANTNEREVRGFINQYIPSGLNYIITTY
jgi:hypothetical protein